MKNSLEWKESWLSIDSNSFITTIVQRTSLLWVIHQRRPTKTDFLDPRPCPTSSVWRPPPLSIHERPDRIAWKRKILRAGGVSETQNIGFRTSIFFVFVYVLFMPDPPFPSAVVQFCSPPPFDRTCLMDAPLPITCTNDFKLFLSYILKLVLAKFFTKYWIVELFIHKFTLHAYLDEQIFYLWIFTCQCHTLNNQTMY